MKTSKQNTEKQHQHQHREKSRKTTKPNQLIHHIYCKTVQLIIDSRIEHNPSSKLNQSQPKLDKWFNLELQDPDYFKEELKTWKSISSLLFNHPLSNSTSSTSFPANSPQSPNFEFIPVLILETILDLQELPSDSFLTFIDNQGNEISVDHRINQQSTTTTTRSQIQKNIVIEKWSVSLVGPIPSQPGPELPTVYRHSIIHFRAFYSFLRTMPASSLFHRLKNRNNKEYGILKIGCRLSPASPCDHSQPILHRITQQNSCPQEIGLHQPLSNAHPHLHDSVTNFNFPSIQTPFGSICTRVTYRNQVEFRIGDKERVLSSHFRNEDQLECPSRLISYPTMNHRLGYPKLIKSGSSAPISKIINPSSQTFHFHQSDRDSLSHPSGFSSDHRRPTSYSSISTRRLSTGQPSSNNYFPFSTGLESTKPCENSLSNEILAATQSSPFVFSGLPESNHRPQINNVATCNSSALTAKLVAHRQSLPPVLSNALPLPSSFNRPNSSVSTTETGNKIVGTSGASPRQLSIVSSSPRSGPSSSIRISTAIQSPPFEHTSSTPGHLLPGTSPPTSIGSIGSYPPISGPLSPLSDQIHTTNSTSRPILPSQPMVRRYSSSRHSRSFGQASSSGGGSLLTAESGSLGVRRRTFSISKQSTSSFDESSKKSIDDDRNKINEFLQLINSQIVPSSTSTGDTLSSHLNRPYQTSSTFYHNRNDYEKRIEEVKSATTHPSELKECEEDQLVHSESIDSAAAMTYLNIEDGDQEEENKLNRLMKEKLDLTLKKLAGSVFTASRQEIPIRIPTSDKLIKFDHDNNNHNEDAGRNNNNSSGANISSNNHQSNSKERNVSMGVLLSSSGSAKLQGLKEEQEDELEEHETSLHYNNNNNGLSVKNFDEDNDDIAVDQVDSIEVDGDGIHFEF